METFFIDYPIFVETGTFVGYTTLIMEKLFSKKLQQPTTMILMRNLTNLLCKMEQNC